MGRRVGLGLIEQEVSVSIFNSWGIIESFTFSVPSRNNKHVTVIFHSLENVKKQKLV